MHFIFHHIGVACRSIEEQLGFYETLGGKKVMEFEDPLQKVKGVFVSMNATLFELLEPLNDSSPIHSYINNNVQMYHQPFECSDIKQAIEYLVVEKGSILVSPPQPSVAFKGMNIAFVLLRNKMLIELIGR